MVCNCINYVFFKSVGSHVSSDSDDINELSPSWLC